MAQELANASVSPQAPAAPAPAALPSPFADVAAGSVPAVSLAPIQGGKTNAAQEFVVSNLDSLSEAGLDYHEVAETSESVIFNPSKITPAQIDEAVAAGKLHEIAPLATDLKPIGGAAPQGAPQGAPQVAPQAAPLANATVSSGNNAALGGARLKNATAKPSPDPVKSLSKRAL